MTTTTKLPTSLRAFAEQRTAEAKAGENVQQLARPRVFAVNPLEIVVYPERNIRPIERDFEHSDLSWPEWVVAAIARLKRESEDELVNLLASPKPSSRAGKKNLSFRVYPSTLNAIRDLAARYDSTVQAVLTHAFFMQSLAADL